MSIRVMSRVWEMSKQKGSALLLLLAIADHAADDGYCWPGIPVLAEKIRMSERSVMRLVKQIEQDRELYVVRGNRNNRYVVTVDMRQSNLDAVARSRGFPLPEYPSDNLSPNKVTRDTDGAIDDTAVTSEVTQPCHPNLHEPSINQDAPQDGDSADDHSVLDHHDPLSMIMHCAEKRKELGGAPDWAMEPEGVHRFYPVLLSFCTMTQQDPLLLRPKQGKSWLTKYDSLCYELDLLPADLLQAHEFLPDKDRGAWYVENHKWSTPYNTSYVDQLMLAAMQVKGGTITTKNGWSKAMS